MKRLILALLVVVGGVPSQAIAMADDATLARLREAGSVRLIVEQSFIYTPRREYRKATIEGYRLPFARVARDLLEDAGLRVVEADDMETSADMTLTITAQGRAIGRLYLDGVEEFLFTGAEIIGDISFTAPGVAPWSTEFRSQFGPPLRLHLNLGFDKPEGAPFIEAFHGATSFIARFMTVLAEIYGAPPLIAALESGDDAVRRFAARVLGDFGGDGVGDALVETLGDQDPRLRKEAAWSLGRLRDAAAVPTLTAALDDTDGDVRWFATWALERIAQYQAESANPETASAPGN